MAAANIIRNIGKLPSNWDTSEDAEIELEDERAEVNQDDYIEAVARLQDLSARRLTLQQKLNTYQTLLSLLEPYCKPQENIQPNLVGRDAPLALDLAQTRTLAIRVAGRINEKLGDVQVPATDDGDDVLMLEDDGNTKVKKILSTW
jgi:DNA repair exonuclease SbcCD ATPase subunit